jgi:N6-L-threonylcarbamoyladenine synthase
MPNAERHPAMSRELMLAIESTCDETAAAVIDRERRILSNIVSTQEALHARFGGVVPEIASRAHVERILPVIDEALRQANAKLADLAVIAVATEPGLVGSLLVGLTAAKSLAWALGIPLVAVNHLEAHIYACQLAAEKNVFPCVGLVISGGHTNLYDCETASDFTLLGTTIDDAAGEAFDKAAQILGLGYPGGPVIEKAAAAGNPNAVNFPRTFLHDDKLQFSFSGLKTAILYEATGIPGSRTKPSPLSPQRIADLAASFQAAVVDIVVAKCRQALARTKHRRLCVGGGVAANQKLRSDLAAMTTDLGVELLIAPWTYCTDNAAMSALGWEHFERGNFAALDLDVTPGLVRMR